MRIHNFNYDRSEIGNGEKLHNIYFGRQHMIPTKEFQKLSLNIDFLNLFR